MQVHPEKYGSTVTKIRRLSTSLPTEAEMCANTLEDYAMSQYQPTAHAMIRAANELRRLDKLSKGN